MLFFSFRFLLVSAPSAVGVSVPSADRGFDAVVRGGDPDGVRTSTAFGDPEVAHRGSDDSGVTFDAGFSCAAVWAWAGPVPFPRINGFAGVTHDLPSVMTTARIPSEILFVWWRRSQSMTCRPMPRYFTVADQGGRIPILPCEMRLNRHGRPPSQPTRTIRHNRMTAGTLTMRPSTIHGSACIRQCHAGCSHAPCARRYAACTDTRDSH